MKYTTKPRTQELTRRPWTIILIFVTIALLYTLMVFWYFIINGHISTEGTGLFWLTIGGFILWFIPWFIERLYRDELKCRKDAIDLLLDEKGIYCGEQFYAWNELIAMRIEKMFGDEIIRIYFKKRSLYIAKSRVENYSEILTALELYAKKSRK